MKTRILSSTLIFSIVFLASCNKGDDTGQIETLNGIWNLKNVSGGFQGVDIDYSRGQVIWNFNLTRSTLVVENNIVTTGPEDIHAGLDSGTYNIEILQNGEIQTLFIDDVERGVLMLLNNNLKIDDGIAVDGFITEFER